MEPILPPGADSLLLAVLDHFYEAAERAAVALTEKGKADDVLPFLTDLSDHPEEYGGDHSVMATWARRRDEVFLESLRPINTVSDLRTTDPVEPATPEVGWRDDGKAMLYPGRTHSLNGESETGKSWLAATLALQISARGRGVMVIDWEDEWTSWASRFHAIGWGDHHSGPIRHMAARVALTDKDWDQTGQWVTDSRCSLIVVDGVTEALGAYGADEIKATDVAHWTHKLPERLAQMGPAVLLIDHLARTHGGTSERYAAGSRHKLAALTGAAFTLTLSQTFAVGRKGMSSVSIAKDRPGLLRSETTDDGSTWAEFILDGSADGTATPKIVKPVSSAGLRRPDVQAHSRVSAFVHRNPGCSISEIEEGVEAPAAQVRAVRDRLVRLEFIAVEKGPRGAQVHKEIKAYDPAEDPDLVPDVKQRALALGDQEPF